MCNTLFSCKNCKNVKAENVDKLFAMKTCTMTKSSQINFYSTFYYTIDFKGALQNMHVSCINVFKYTLSKSETLTKNKIHKVMRKTSSYLWSTNTVHANVIRSFQTMFFYDINQLFVWFHVMTLARYNQGLVSWNKGCVSFLLNLLWKYLMEIIWKP